MKYELYGFLHKIAKRVLGRCSGNPAYRMIDVSPNKCNESGELRFDVVPEYFNEMHPGIDEVHINQVFPLENIVPSGSCMEYQDSYQRSTYRGRLIVSMTAEESTKAWSDFIDAATIEPGYRNSGLRYAGFIRESNRWCLPSWIWTNAAIARMFCRTGEIEKAKDIGELLIGQQKQCGGWVVRNDYDSDGAIPVLAPNDSAYIANNALLELYIATGEERYLLSAIQCAEWIMLTAREDGMVYVGYDMRRDTWQKGYNIVDTGFTAGLFSRLYEITNNKKYLIFLKRFVKAYINLFYSAESRGFMTALDADDRPLGGMFGRGQAWALEGLIPASKVLNDPELDDVIETTVKTLLNRQTRKGAWAYNLQRPLMGIDCKAVPIIACSLLNWRAAGHGDDGLVKSAKAAFKWCCDNTSASGDGRGGIFSYSVEGAVVHHLYTSTAFVYSSAYAIELGNLLAEEN